MLKEIVHSIQSFFEVFDFIRKHRLWFWVLLPGIVYAALLYVGIYVFIRGNEDVIMGIEKLLGVGNWLEINSNNAWLGVVFTLSSIMFTITMLVFYFSIVKYIFLIVGAPVFAYLSKKAEKVNVHEVYIFSWTSYVAEVRKGIFFAYKNFFKQLKQTWYYFPLSLVPIVGWVVPLLMFYVECYYFGSSMIEYCIDRNNRTSLTTHDLILKHAGMPIGNGLMFYIFHLFPFVGWVLAPSFAIIAATLSVKDTNVFFELNNSVNEDLQQMLQGTKMLYEK